jgi:tRNA (guanine37-N1)-methyltransferase
MEGALQIDIITLFPGMISGFLGESILKRAARKGAVSFRLVNPRDFTTDAHHTADDRPYGGGPGMILKPEPVFAAVESVRAEDARVVLMTPQGRPFTQAVAAELAGERHLTLVCGHYEGVDERIRAALVDDEISIGDYVLTNGALAAAVVVDAVVRLRTGVLGAEDATVEESFSRGLLEYPQYTRPAEFRGLRVPAVLLSGDHAEIERWRADQAVRRTRERRPDLMSAAPMDTLNDM